MKQPVCPFCGETEFGLREVYFTFEERRVLAWDEDGQPAKLDELSEEQLFEPHRIVDMWKLGETGDSSVSARQIIGMPIIHCMHCNVSFEHAPREDEVFPEDYEWL